MRGQVAIAAYSGDPPPHMKNVIVAYLDKLRELCGPQTLILGGYRGMMKLVVDEALQRGYGIVLVIPREYELEPVPQEAIVIRTGMDLKARSAILVRSGDLLVSFGGASGTLVEVLMAYGLGKPVIYFTGTGLPTDALVSAYPMGMVDARIGQWIFYVGSPVEAAEKTCKLLHGGIAGLRRHSQ